MLLVSYECSRSFAARAGAFAGALSTGWAAPGLAAARGAAALAALAGGLTSCAAATATTAAIAATRGIRPAAALAALAAVTAADTSLPAATAATAAGTVVVAATRAGKLSHRLAACLATATLISRPSAHISRLHQAFLIEPNQIQATGLRKRLHH